MFVKWLEIGQCPTVILCTEGVPQDVLKTSVCFTRTLLTPYYLRTCIVLLYTFAYVSTTQCAMELYRFCTKGVAGCRLKGDSTLVSCPDYFSHAEGKSSLVNCLFNFCSDCFTRMMSCIVTNGDQRWQGTCSAMQETKPSRSNQRTTGEGMPGLL